MMRLVIFGGTAEGRYLVERLSGYGTDISVCVATEYGGSLLPKKDNVHIHIGRMDACAMEQFLLDIRPDFCIDATHPYAELVTENVYAACVKSGVKYIRVSREDTLSDEAEGIRSGEIIFRDTVKDAAHFLKSTEGGIFITTGSKELGEYTVIENYAERCTVRVLPVAEVVDKCAKLGFLGKKLICMQGPFDGEMNYLMFKASGAGWLVTKNTGKAGGFDDKCDAAIRAGMKVIVIGRPKERPEKAYTPDETCRLITSQLEDNKTDSGNTKRTVYLIGMGIGDGDLLTGEARKVIGSCDVLIGAERVLNIYDGFKNKPYYVCCKADDIRRYIEEHGEYRNIALLYSGDIGFYSGAASFAADCEYEVRTVTGISSPIYFMNRLNIAWQDVRFVSNHGKNTPLIPLIRDNRYVCSLLGDGHTVADTCRRLIDYGMENVSVTVGERLSYDDERITSGRSSDMADREFSPLAVVLFDNAEYERRAFMSGIPDSKFIRGSVPMTKSEVRAVSVSKLRLSEGFVLYDIGAGTGSVSIEASFACGGGTVYAIDKNEEALSLIDANKKKFKADNVVPVFGSAPEVLDPLPAPTHVFIGGSGGRLIPIIEAVRRKNINARFVINAVTVETLAELTRLAELYPEYGDMELVCAGIARGIRAGGYHMLKSENQVYIAGFQAGETAIIDAVDES